MNKPKILICLYAYFPFANSNTNVMLPIIKELSKIFDVSILTKNFDNSAPVAEVMEDVKVYRFQHQPFPIRLVQAFYYIDLDQNRNFLKRLIIRVGKSISNILMKIPFFEYSEVKCLTEILQRGNVNVILSTCESFASHHAVLRLKEKQGLSIPWFAYFMDPYAFFIGHLGKNASMLKAESMVYQESNAVFVTDEIYRENLFNIHKQHINKTYPVHYPNFRILQSRRVNAFFVDGKINCVYAGSLFNSIVRDPSYLYKVINRLDDRYVFHIICNSFSKDNMKLRKKWLKKNSNVKWYYNLPLNESLDAMCHADILINLGNKTINQTPSKVFDYIGTGKPIINFYSLSDDTSKYYLQDYPSKLNVYERDELLNENIKAINNFVSEKMGSKVDEAQLMAIYGKYSGQIAAKQMIETIVNLSGVQT